MNYYKNHGLAKMQEVDADLFNALKRQAREILFSAIKSAVAENPDYIHELVLRMPERLKCCLKTARVT